MVLTKIQGSICLYIGCEWSAGYRWHLLLFSSLFWNFLLMVLMSTVINWIFRDLSKHIVQHRLSFEIVCNSRWITGSTTNCKDTSLLDMLSWWHFKVLSKSTGIKSLFGNILFSSVFTLFKNFPVLHNWLSNVFTIYIWLVHN